MDTFSWPTIDTIAKTVRIEHKSLELKFVEEMKDPTEKKPHSTLQLLSIGKQHSNYGNELVKDCQIAEGFHFNLYNISMGLQI